MKTLLITFFSTYIFMVQAPVGLDQNFVLSTGNTVKVSGTSSLHDWEEKVNEVYCDVNATIETTKVNFESLTFKVKAKSLKSDKDLMDKKTYEALKADKYPDITFKMTSASEMALSSDSFKGTITGTLTMAGKTKNISVAITGKTKSANSMQISGSKKLKMTEFDMVPPTALMGTIKTGDEVTVTFNLNLITK